MKNKPKVIQLDPIVVNHGDIVYINIDWDKEKGEAYKLNEDKTQELGSKKIQAN